MNGGQVIFKFKGDTSEIQKDTKNIGSIVKGTLTSLGIAAVVSKGINAISGSLDGAISRLDTMNNYSKVMSNLGIDAKDSQKSIDKLSKKLNGLPTTLDSAAGAVQRFTSANNDIGKSTDMFIALNNALLAGGASADIQASAMEQLSQAYAKGRPDAMEWRSMLTAMPAQLKQVANSLGYTSTAVGGDFYTAIQNGTLSMDDFMGAIINLNDNGTGEFASFETQAKNSVDGIATNLTNFKTAIVRGVANMINSINKSLSKADLPTIQEMVQIATKKISEAFTKLSSFIESINLKGIISTIKTLMPLIVAVFAGFMAYKTVIGVIQAVAAAQALLNAVMLINPIGLVVAAIAGLVAGFIYLWNNCEGFRNFWIGLWEGLKNAFAFWVEGFKLMIDGIVNIFTGVIDFVKNNWQGLLLLLVNPFAGAFKLLYDNCQGFRNFINGFVGNIVSTFKSIVGSIVSAFNGIKDKMFNIGKDMINGLINGVKHMASGAVNAVKNVGKSILGGIKGVLGIHSPSKEFASIGEFSIMGYEKGLQDMQPELQNELNSMFDLSPNLYGTSSANLSPNVNVVVNNNMKQDALGQLVNDIKTFSGGAKNDYNYGM